MDLSRRAIDNSLIRTYICMINRSVTIGNDFELINLYYEVEKFWIPGDINN